MSRPLPVLAALLASWACSRGPEDPDLAVQEMLRDAMAVLAEAGVEAGDPMQGPEQAELRRRLRERFDARIRLPFPLTWSRPEVDYATGVAADYLLRLEESGYDLRLLERDDDADPPTALVQVEFEDQRGRPLAALLHLERRGGRWVWTEPFRRPR